MWVKKKKKTKKNPLLPIGPTGMLKKKKQIVSIHLSGNIWLQKKEKKKSQKPPRVKAFLVIQLYLFLSVTIGPFFLFSPMRVSLLSQNLERNSTAS